MNHLPESLLDAVVDKQLLGGGSGEAAPRAMHIVFGIDGHYARCMGVAITALIWNNREAEMVFHIFSCSLSVDDRNKLSRLAAESGRNIYLYQIDRRYFANWPLYGHYSCAAYYRLIAPPALESITARCLYLDADVICLQSIAGLQDINLQENIAAVVSDRNGFAEERSAELGLAQRRYFNSGVMYIDVKKWNEERVSARCADVLQESPIPLYWLDQDALNIVCDGKTIFLDKKWNFRFDVGSWEGDIAPETVLLHYTATRKPWHAVCRNPVKRYFFEYADLSPWRNEPPENPSSYPDMLLYARILAAERKYAAGMVWAGRGTVLRLLAYQAGLFRRLKQAIQLYLRF